MSQETNISTRDLSASSPRLRSDLRIHFQDGGYVLEDPLTGTFFKIGPAEYRFLKLLDGSRTISGIVGQLSVEANREALTEDNAHALIRVLADSNLLEGGGREHAERVRDENYRKTDGKKLIGHWKSLLFCRIPLGNPDRILDRILPFFGWFVAPGFFLVWLAVVAGGAISVTQNWTRFREEMTGIFEVGNLLILGVIWMALKLFHEGCHALVCKKFGGNVPEMGVMLLLFVTPLGYVNATSATKFSSKWKRIFVSLAGIYGELFAAGLAASIWALLDPGLLSKGLHEVIVISSITTILFNANPLMRFDGYYVLSDLTGVANLYSKAQRSFGFWMRRWFLGANPEKHPLPDRDRRKWITLYGMGTSVWRIMIVAGILAFVSYQWHGAGLVVVGFIGIAMLFSTLDGGISYFKKTARNEDVSIVKTGLRAVVLGLVLVALFSWVRVSPGVWVPAVVDWQSGGEVRVDCPGFVEKVFVRNGDQVRKGDLLLRIRNRDEEARFKQLSIEQERSRIRASQFLQNEDIASYQAEEKQIEARKQRLLGLEKYLSSLELTAQYHGIVFGRELENIEGTYLDKGQVFCTVGQENSKRLLLAIAEDEFDTIRDSVGMAVKFRTRGRIGTVAAKLNRIHPHASTRIPHFSLIVPAGGPIVARKILESEGGSGDANARIHADALTRQFELAKPHLEGEAGLESEVSRHLEVGEVGRLKIYCKDQRSLWQLLSNRLHQAYRNAGEKRG